MREKPHSDLLHCCVSPNLDETIAILKQILNASENDDVKCREFKTRRFRICVVYMDGMVDEQKIGEFVLHAIKTGNEAETPGCGDPMECFNSGWVEIAQTQAVTEIEELIPLVLSGMSALLLEGSSRALMLETRDYPHRSVERPTSESVVNGPHEGFVEHMRTNISLVRRYVQSANLIVERINVGTAIQTGTSLLYLKGVANENCVQEARRRLKSIQASTVHGSGDIQQLIEDHPLALLPQMLQTERPDRVGACLEDGQVAILVENSPYALIAPVTVFHLIHAADDSFLRWQYGSALRLIRSFGLIVSLILPALYISMSLYHTHLIPMSLLTSIAESRANVPFPIVVEVLFMEFSFYLLNEAGLRTPSEIGSAFGIVGALILGQAAVSASVVSPILIIIIAVTGLGNYVIPNYSFGIGIVLYRLILIVLSALFGLYGLVIGVYLMITHLCSIKSFGVEYLAPVAPHRRHNPDILLRLPIWMQKRTMFFTKSETWIARKGAKE